MEKRCQNCNQMNPPEAAFCLNCAAPLSANPFGNQQANQANVGNPQARQNFAPPVAASNGMGQKATIALILAIVGLLCCGPFTSVPAMAIGWLELDAIKKGQSPPAGKTYAQVGLWLGAGATVLHIVGYLFWVLLSMASNPYGY